ncbi:Phosphoglucomutase-3 [Onygenales sp. PD_10]|nr:Phosphoglucomutase-3 [Onygenales sp. PD_10]
MEDPPMTPLSDLVQQWLEWDQDPETLEEIRRLQKENDEDELEKRLRKRIEFGTAGLRGRMQAGFSFMNGLTVIQASQGLAKFIKQSHQGPEPATIVIGRDARYNSKKFAALAANAFEAEGIHVLWYQSVSPTPLVPFGVLVKGASAGVMVTASHNPAKDNGYKVYFSNGAQINSPVDSQIAELIRENLKPWPSAWKTVDQNQFLGLDSHEEITGAYCNAVTQFVNSTKTVSDLPRPFVYTPLHGVGFSTMSRLCQGLRIKDMITVAEQQDPDPDFPTVKFPNPEESGALDLAMKTADSVSRDLIIANDPDADRLAVAEKVDGIWIKLTGDQVGVLLASYMLDTMKAQGKMGKKTAMLSTAVSTSMLSKMGEIEGFYFQETLTGFKWLGNVAKKLESEGYDVPFAFEEALGYMFPKVCYDKDGLTAAMVFLAAEAKWRTQGLSPYAKLQQLYQTYGYHENLNTYFVSPDTQTTKSLFEAIRNRSDEQRKVVGSLPITRWRDMTVGFDSGTTDNIPRLPIDSSSQMLTVWSERGIRFTLRGSGTEPKVKIYIESCCGSHEEAVKAVCDAFLAVLEDWIRPYAPNMTYASRLPTSSGHILSVD